MKNSIEIPIIVSSFDDRQACWPAWCHGFQKYLSDWNGPLLFLSNFIKSPCGHAMLTGQEKRWPFMIKSALNFFPASIVIMTLEDFWITRKVNCQEILEYVQLIEHNIVDYIRLYPNPYPDHPFTEDSRLGILDTEAYFRASTQMSLWRKDILLDLICDSETIWEFEERGTERSRKYGGRFLSVNDLSYGVNYVHAVEQGTWTPGAYKYAEIEGITID